MIHQSAPWTVSGIDSFGNLPGQESSGTVARMAHEIVQVTSRKLARAGPDARPTVIADAGEKASRRFLEFFTANIRNKNTRLAYARAVSEFLDWCDKRGLQLHTIEPKAVAAYIEQLQTRLSAPTIKQNLAAIRMMFNGLVIGQVVPVNPAAAVRGPAHVVQRGKTLVLTADQAREFLDSIDMSTIIGLRDRALIGIMVYTFARVGAVVTMKAEDYFQDGNRWWFRLHEKGGKRHEVPAHHNAEAFMDEYLQAAGIGDDKKSPLFRSVNKHRSLTENPMNRADVLRMIKRRAAKSGLPPSTCCHTFRATGITAYLDNGGNIENAQAIAAHESPRTTKLYDRTSDEITFDEVEKIII